MVNTIFPDHFADHLNLDRTLALGLTLDSKPQTLNSKHAIPNPEPQISLTGHVPWACIYTLKSETARQDAYNGLTAGSRLNHGGAGLLLSNLHVSHPFPAQMLTPMILEEILPAALHHIRTTSLKCLHLG